MEFYFSIYWVPILLLNPLPVEDMITIPKSGFRRISFFRPPRARASSNEALCGCGAAEWAKCPGVGNSGSHRVRAAAKCTATTAGWVAWSLMCQYPPVIKHGNGQPTNYLKMIFPCKPFKTSIYREFSIATFDYQRVP